uniref:Tetratricopeptide repeat protein 29 n=1 Tax=Sinocyclocheilus rhinocerous TaxID=307959 RepID=A0A673K2U8_9TELE
MSSALVSGSRTPLLPDIYNPHKHRTTPTSKSSPEWMKENPVHPAAEKTQIPTEFTEPLRQSVCVALLREGFPRSFAQMFSLLQRWDAADPHELHTLQQRLTSAETAERHGQYGEAYDNHMFLARFFTEPEDKWLKHHFIQLALHSARKFKMDSGKREAEANLHMGQVYLEKAEDRGSEGEAAYRLGLAYQSTGDQKTAKQFFSVCMEISTILENADSLGRAYEAIAKSLESEGKLTEATEYLEKFAEISLSSKQDRNLEKACMCLGNILSLRKRYDGAHEHFGRAYEIACNLASVVRLQKARVCAGSARALSMMQTYHRLIETPGRQNIKRIISWKKRRHDSLSAPL